MSGTLTAKPIVVYRVLRHGVEVNETDSLICNNSNRTLHLKNQSAIFFILSVSVFGTLVFVP